MKIKNFQGDLTDISAKKVPRPCRCGESKGGELRSKLRVSSVSALRLRCGTGLSIHRPKPRRSIPRRRLGKSHGTLSHTTRRSWLSSVRCDRKSLHTITTLVHLNPADMFLYTVNINYFQGELTGISATTNPLMRLWMSTHDQRFVFKIELNTLICFDPTHMFF